MLRAPSEKHSHLPLLSSGADTVRARGDGGVKNTRKQCCEKVGYIPQWTPLVRDRVTACKEKNKGILSVVSCSLLPHSWPCFLLGERACLWVQAGPRVWFPTPCLSLTPRLLDKDTVLAQMGHIVPFAEDRFRASMIAQWSFLRTREVFRGGDSLVADAPAQSIL